MDVRPLASDAQEFNIADPVLRRGVLVLRWLLVGAYVLLVRLGVLDVSGQALLISASMIASWSLLHTVAELTGRGLDPRLVFITRYVDVMMETTALIALHDVRN